MTVNGPTELDSVINAIVTEICVNLHSEVSKCLETMGIDNETLKESLEEKDQRIEELEQIIAEAQSELCGLEESIESVAAEVGVAFSTLANA